MEQAEIDRGVGMTEVAKVEIADGIGVLIINSPPVNALGIATRRGLQQGLSQLFAEPSVRSIVLICEGRTFFAGADISEFGKPPLAPTLRDLVDMIEKGSKPVVAAIHGSALGGGLELALACSYRIASPSAKLGLPEVKLGLLPGAGGTQRLPRIVGVDTALDLIVSGRAISAQEALDFGVINAVANDEGLRREAISFARAVSDQPLVHVRDQENKIADARGKPEIFEEFRKRHAREFKGFKAPENIVKSIEAAVELEFDEGLKRERELFLELVSSNESSAQRYAFFAERETAKLPDIPSSTPTLPIASVGVIGAGTMGGGIAMNFLNAGVPVTLIEMNGEALDRGLKTIRRNYESSVRKGKLTSAELEQRMALIDPRIGLEGLSPADLVIEAVFEEMSVKKAVFAELDRLAKPGAILASNTSFLDLDEIAAATSRPEFVVGLHFFSPANIMRLLEVVRGKETSPEVIATSMKLAKKIGKVPVLSRVCYGFIANRIMAKRSVQAEALILEGVAPSDVDQALIEYGFAMGPFQMMDLVGLDVLTRGVTGPSIRLDLVNAGRLGQKNGGGFYDYDEQRKASPSPKAAQIIADFVATARIPQSGPQTAEEIRERLLFPVVNEGARLLEEGIAVRASDIDIAAILGYNWPIFTGGPMFWGDTIGLPRIVARLKDFEARFGAEFKPSALLERHAVERKSLTGK